MLEVTENLPIYRVSKAGRVLLAVLNYESIDLDLLC